jgi:hypothetical protein
MYRIFSEPTQCLVLRRAILSCGPEIRSRHAIPHDIGPGIKNLELWGICEVAFFQQEKGASRYLWDEKSEGLGHFEGRANPHS